MIEKSDTIAEVCAAISRGSLADAADVLRRDYSFAAQLSAGRVMTEVESTRLFIRDGFVDRYSGQRLGFPRRTNSKKVGIGTCSPRTMSQTSVGDRTDGGRIGGR